MPEMKRNFTKGKMNKDLDERLVPPGEYRDAMNIQVSTSDESDVGTIQNVLGNTRGCVYTNPSDNPVEIGSKTIGSVSDEKNDSLYWLVAGPTSAFLHSSNNYYIKKDMIMRTNSNLNTGCEPVFVDIYNYSVENQDNSSSTNLLNSPGIIDFAVPGMTATGYNANSVQQFSQVVTNVGSINSIPSIDYFSTPGDPDETIIIPATNISPPQSSVGAYVDCGNEFALNNIIGQGPYNINDPGAYVPTGFYDISGAFSMGQPNVQQGGEFYLQIADPSNNVIINTADWSIIPDPFGGNTDVVVLTNPDDILLFQQEFASGNYIANNANYYQGCGNGVGGATIDMSGWIFSLSYILPVYSNDITITNSTWIDEIELALSSGITVSIDPGSNSWPPNSCIVGTGVPGVYSVEDCDGGFDLFPFGQNNITLSFSNDLSVNAAVLAEDVDLSNVSIIEFSLPRVLNFKNDSIVTGINIIDDMLFWTDNFTEPKKININRSIAGTDPSGNIHTAIVNDATGLSLANYEPIQEEHITVIRKSPKNAISLTTSIGRDPELTYSGITYTSVDPSLHSNGINASSIIGSSNPSVVVDFSTLKVSDTLKFEIETDSNGDEDFTLQWKQGDIILLKEFDVDIVTGEQTSPPIPLSNWTIRGRITNWQFTQFVNNTNAVGYQPGLVGSDWNTASPPPSAPGTAHVEIEILNVNGTPPQADPSVNEELYYAVDLEIKKEPIFKDKFPRFSYRYKYEDGEYSTFAPFSEVAFAPAHFNYNSKKGYNEGMTNHAVSIQLSGFVPTVANHPLGKDVIEVDILYKEEGSPNVYVVETISPLDIMPTGTPNPWYTNVYNITSESIKYTLPSNQLLRSWDNVPKKALAQDVTGSRIVYGNYEQNFDLTFGNQKYKPEFKNYLTTWGSKTSGSAEKSIKSLRDYKLGVVFTDDYGRETPILISESGGFKVEKRDSAKSNRLVAGLNGSAPANMAYFKFFIKETSSEYYNLAMDRWYEAEDGNIWLAFPSTDRNKVDLETSLYFKKGNDEAVENTTRYKILAIENEAPEFIKTRKLRIGTVTHDVSNTVNGVSTPIYLFGASGVGNALNNAPRVGEISFTMNWNQTTIASSSLRNLDDITEELYMQFALNGAYSKKYKISEITKDTTAGLGNSGEYYITLAENLKEDMDFIFDNAANPGAIKDQVKVLFSKSMIENKPIYEGRFFAKIENDGRIKTQITDDSVGVNYVELARQSVYVLDNDSQLLNRQRNATFSQGTLGYTDNYFSSMEQLTDFDFSSKVRSDFVGPNDNNYNGENFNFFYARQSYFGYAQLDHDGGEVSYVCNGGGSTYPNSNAPSGSLYGSPIADASGPRLDGCDSGVWFIDRSTHKHTTNSGGDGSVTGLTWANSNNMQGFFPNDNNRAANGWSENQFTGPGIANYPGINSSKITLAFGGIENGRFDVASSTNASTVPRQVHGVTEDFFSVGEEGVGRHGDGDVVNFVKNFTSGSKFKWQYDPTETVYTFYNQISVKNNVRFSRHDMGYDSDLVPHGRLLIDQKSGSYHRSWDLWVEPSMDNTAGSGWDPSAEPGTFMTKGLHLQGIELLSHDLHGSSNSINNGIDPTTNYIIVNTLRSVCLNNTTVNETYALHKGMMLTAYNGNAAGTFIDTPVLNGSASNVIVKEIGEFDASYGPDSNGNMGGYKIELAGYEKPLHYNGAEINTDLVNTSAGSATFLEFRQVSMNGASNYTEHNTDYFKQFWLDDSGNTSSVGPMGAVGYDMIMVSPVDEYTDGGNLPPDPFVWETEPKDNEGLDIYYEISENNPINLNSSTIVSAIPIGSKVENTSALGTGTNWSGITVQNNISATGDTIEINLPPPMEGIWIGPGPFVFNNIIIQPLAAGDTLKITKPSGVSFDVEIAEIIPNVNNPQVASKFVLKTSLYNSDYYLNWYNCYSFYNGVESNRIKDSFNLPYILNGVKASTTLGVDYEQERRDYGLIYSGIYNSTSGVNNLNQFIQAEKITKDLNPIYGSIQKLKAGWGQSGDLIALCEDRILKILANKDALFNADGNTNVTATNKVLGTAVPYSGEYGISKNPESFASESYRAYFTDKVRGTVMRLSMDGLTPISDFGMKDWFRDNLKLNNTIVGSYDDKKDEYNISLPNTTEPTARSITFKENVKGWVSFKSFITNNGISCANEYYTFLNGNLWKHNDETVDRNTFYNNYFNSTFDVVFNDAPGIVKSFYTLNYEGSNSKVNANLGNLINDSEHDIDYYNTHPYQIKEGWYVESVYTNKESGTISEFIEKEGKWFNYIRGEEISHGAQDSIIVDPNGNSNFKQANFAIQGLGSVDGVASPPQTQGCTDPTANNHNPNATVDDGSCTYALGCTEGTAANYDPLATTEDGSCYFENCFDQSAYQYHPQGGNLSYNTVNAAALAYSAIYPGPPSPLVSVGCINVILGCADAGQFNSNNPPGANINDGSCEPFTYGCLGQNGINATQATNYAGPNNQYGNPEVNTDNGSCTFQWCDLNANDSANNNIVTGDAQLQSQNYTLGAGGVIDNQYCISGGCTDQTASNYNSGINALGNVTTWDDGSCSGCTDPNACNYNPNVDIDDGNCSSDTCFECGFNLDPMDNLQVTHVTNADQNNGVIVVTIESFASFQNNTYPYQVTINGVSGTPGPGGTLSWSNLTPGTYTVLLETTIPDNTCEFTLTGDVLDQAVSGCTNPAAFNYDPSATVNDGSCIPIILGCIDSNAANFGCTGVNIPPCNDNPNTDGGNCLYGIYGCTNAAASNYDPTASIDDGTCIVVLALDGCTDPYATNYDANATVDDGTCSYDQVVISEEAPAATGRGRFYGQATTMFDILAKLDAVDGTTYTSGKTSPNYVGHTGSITVTGLVVRRQVGGQNTIIYQGAIDFNLTDPLGNYNNSIMLHTGSAAGDFQANDVISLNQN